MSEPQSLVERIKAGDREALAEYISGHAPQLRSFIEKRMSDGLRRRVDPDDVLQDLAASALRTVHTVELGDREPFGWLCQQAERKIIDAHRHHFGAQKRAAGREVHLDNPAGGGGEGGGALVDLLAASMTSPSAAFSRQQKEFFMLQALGELPPDGREALRLRYVEGLPSKEIAERLGKTDGAVRVLLTRSLRKLQEVLGRNTDFQTLLAQQRPPEERPLPG